MRTGRGIGRSGHCGPAASDTHRPAAAPGVGPRPGAPVMTVGNGLAPVPEPGADGRAASDEGAGPSCSDPG